MTSEQIKDSLISYKKAFNSCEYENIYPEYSVYTAKNPQLKPLFFENNLVLVIPLVDEYSNLYGISITYSINKEFRYFEGGYEKLYLFELKDDLPNLLNSDVYFEVKQINNDNNKEILLSSNLLIQEKFKCFTGKNEQDEIECIVFSLNCIDIKN